MRHIIALLFVGMLLAGCTQPAEAPAQPSAPADEEPGAEQPEETPEPEEEVEAPTEEPEEEMEYTDVATSQEECATMSPDCESCISKKNCGWCKDSNSCLYGSASGPNTGQCPSDEWAVTIAACSVVDEDESCSDLTNCADCLSGSGCKWCIQGALCASESSTESCFGDWMTESYQCNYASR